VAYVATGGFATGAIIGGGTLEIASGGSTGSGPVTFAGGGGILQLDGGSIAFGGTIAGFAQPDELDLPDFVFGSASGLGFSEAGSNLSGTLTVSDAVHVVNLTLLGQYSASQFSLGSDGHGGTLVTDPPAAAASEPVALVTGHPA
jgi:hypothetical protein